MRNLRPAPGVGLRFFLSYDRRATEHRGCTRHRPSLRRCPIEKGCRMNQLVCPTCGVMLFLRVVRGVAGNVEVWECLAHGQFRIGGVEPAEVPDGAVAMNRAKRRGNSVRNPRKSTA